MLETRYRARYRRLQWHTDATTNASFAAAHTEEKSSDGIRTRPGSTTSVSGSQTSCAESEACAEDDDDLDDLAHQREYNKAQDFTFDGFRQPDSEAETLPSLHPDNSSNATPSIASWSSNSKNPFLRSMKVPELKVHVAQSLADFPPNVWDDPIAPYPTD